MKSGLHTRTAEIEASRATDKCEEFTRYIDSLLQRCKPARNGQRQLSAPVCAHALEQRSKWRPCSIESCCAVG